jgi:hypothetical protein
MAKKRKAKRKDSRKAHGKVDPVRVQVAIQVAKIPGLKERLTNKILNDIVQRFVDTGETPRGIKVTAIKWINPSRVNETLARWKSSGDSDQTMAAARATLKGVIRRIKFSFPGFR